MKSSFRKILSCAISGAIILSLSACGSSSVTAPASTEASSQTAAAAESETASSEASEDSYTENTAALTIDSSRWQYDADNDVYYQLGVQYCSSPEDTVFETMGIYVPGSYMSAVENGDGTYTCTVNSNGSVSDYSASTAPIVVPVNTPEYASSAAPTEYSYNDISSYMEAGFIYIQPGIRGRKSTMGQAETTSSDTESSDSASGGAPWGVTDLKAAIRYYRYNAAVLPGSTDSIFSFGMSGGGAQSSVLGATGDSELYFPYLEAIGAAMTDADGNTISDAVCGSMCWCPITNLDSADEAYEWNMGQFASTGSRADGTFTGQLSDDLAAAFADYINNLGLTDVSGNALTLEESDSGIYQAGTYYDYLLSIVDTSLNNFLSDTTFPYTESSQSTFPGGQYTAGTDAATDAAGGTMPDGMSGNAAGGDGGHMPADGQMPDGMSGNAAGGMGGGQMPGGDGSDSSNGTTYDTVQDYIDSLNSDVEWITYDAATNTASVSSLEAFAEHCKQASKDIGAFDETDRGQGENAVFGDGDATSLHFDSTIYDLLKKNESTYSSLDGWSDSLISDYETDLAYTDELGTDMQTRLNMYTPLYFLLSSCDGYQTSAVAKYWRIRTGIDQSDTALSTEANLALALENYTGVESVDFATVWGLGHTTAERTGDSTSNFIEWVNECMAQ